MELTQGVQSERNADCRLTPMSAVAWAVLGGSPSCVFTERRCEGDRRHPHQVERSGAVRYCVYQPK